MDYLSTQEKTYLQNAYYFYQRYSNSELLRMQLISDPDFSDMKENAIDALKFLESKALISDLNITENECAYRITQNGIEYFEPVIPEQKSIVINQGQNSSAVIGNNNQIQLNISQMLTDVKNSTLDKESKDLLLSFLSNINQEETQLSLKEKVTSFVGNLTTDLATDASKNALTFLISKAIGL